MITPVAVLMSTYCGDEPTHFEAAVDSIARQEGAPPINFYLGVDGPIEARLREAIETRRTLFTTVIYSSERIGLAAMLNRLAAELGDERYVFRMDADDLSLPKRIATQIAYMESNPRVDILGSSILEFSGDKQWGVRSYPRADLIGSYIKIASPVAHPTVVFRRRALDTLGGYPLEGTNEDIAMWFAAVQRGLVIDNVADVLLHYRVGANYYRRRSINKAFREALVYARGIRRLHGLSIWLVLPFVRLIFRLLPKPIVKYIYHSSGIRRALLNIK